MKDASQMRSADKAMIKNERGWNVHDTQVKRFFGLDPKKKWPAEGLPAIEIQGFTVYVKSLEESRNGQKRPHRVTVICPICNKHMSLGRLHQHQHHKQFGLYDEDQVLITRLDEETFIPAWNKIKTDVGPLSIKPNSLDDLLAAMIDSDCDFSIQAI